MADMDAATLAGLARRLKLVTDDQLKDCWEELGQPSGPAEPLVRLLERKGYLTPWQTKKLLQGDADGYFLGGYRKLYRVASGTFGRVFRADNPHTGEVVAIKVLRRRWSEDPHNIELFEREGKVGLSLLHPNIVRILAVSRDPITKEYYIVMEFVEGGNLRDFLAIRKKLEAAEALRIAEDAASALTYAFSRGLTHRDMKLTNILIGTSGTTKLVDFGLARMGAIPGLEDDGSNTKVDRTVDYAGLEKATNVKPGDVRSDIFFMGCVLYEMLTGRSPLPAAKDRHARMLRQRFAGVTPMAKEEVNAPQSVFRLVETMMALDPLLRHQTPSQLLEAVRHIRHEVEGGTGETKRLLAGPRTVFVVEAREPFQDAIRERFKEKGYRVLMSANPVRALERLSQQPYDGLVVDAATVGDDAATVFKAIMDRVHHEGLHTAGILILSQDQTELAERLEKNDRTAVMVYPLTVKQLLAKLSELVPLGEKE